MLGQQAHADAPDAPAEIRGPYTPIATNVTCIQISEIFPRMARHADKYALLRSVYHQGAVVHDFGHQLMQTGRLFQFGNEQPHIGCVMSKLKGPKGDAPPYVLLPRPIGNTGGNLPHGQTAGFLGKTFDPFVLNADPSDANFKVPDLAPPDYLPPIRVERRDVQDARDGQRNLDGGDQPVAFDGCDGGARDLRPGGELRGPG